MVTTVDLFNLFYDSGLLEHNEPSKTRDLMRAITVYDECRRSEKFFECIHCNDDGKPISYLSSMPIKKNVWIMQQHCSIVKGHGVSILLDVMNSVMSNTYEIDYVVGFYSPLNFVSDKIWKYAHSLIDDERLCSISRYRYNSEQSSLVPDDPEYQKLIFLNALGYNYSIHKFMGFFSRPTGTDFADGKIYNAILFKVCDSSRNLFSNLFKAN